MDVAGDAFTARVTPSTPGCRPDRLGVTGECGIFSLEGSARWSFWAEIVAELA